MPRIGESRRPPLARQPSVPADMVDVQVRHERISRPGRRGIAHGASLDRSGPRRRRAEPLARRCRTRGQVRRHAAPASRRRRVRPDPVDRRRRLEGRLDDARQQRARGSRQGKGPPR
jgi:hypothetical protein